MNLVRSLARVVVGLLFVGHGTQKLFGWFGGPGIEGTAGMMKALEMNPPRRNAVAAGVTEAGGGALLAVGLATPLACSALIGTMVTAIRKVHGPKGLWATEGGYEYNLVLIAGLLALAQRQPGDISLDAALGLNFSGFKWPLAALVVGAAAAEASMRLGQLGAPAEQATEQPAVQPSGPSEG
ncbi:DoxX family protein [Nocardioides guangzhouensis]|uniref:DoxX family protein n=1 Tax=Nocardioides guangzhouensis TaxID=2497878 RepID=A0A4Q4ZFE5_9ACTN|nr:DoxX family protein [Nocardioides guangzhouensis]RYP86852.1 DoxX family protein [Nocardioides guangzhouensis]